MLKPAQQQSRRRRPALDRQDPKLSGQSHQAAGDALMRRHLVHWRRITARLQVLMNAGTGADVLALEAHSLRRQCERLAQEFNALGCGACPAGASRPPRTQGQRP